MPTYDIFYSASKLTNIVDGNINNAYSSIKTIKAPSPEEVLLEVNNTFQNRKDTESWGLNLYYISKINKQKQDETFHVKLCFNQVIHLGEAQTFDLKIKTSSFVRPIIFTGEIRANNAARAFLELSKKVTPDSFFHHDFFGNTLELIKI